MMRARRISRSIALAGCLLLLGSLTLPGTSEAKTTGQIDTAVNAALARFGQQVKGGAKFIAQSQGVVVFPEVVKAAFLYGQQYGEGALRINGVARSFGYYSFTAKWGASTDVLSKDVIFVFRDAAALRSFELTAGWVVGTNGPVTLIHVGAGDDLSTMRVTAPIAGFVVGSKGLMYDFSLTGAKIGPLNK